MALKNVNLKFFHSIPVCCALDSSKNISFQPSENPKIEIWTGRKLDPKICLDKIIGPKNIGHNSLPVLNGSASPWGHGAFLLIVLMLPEEQIQRPRLVEMPVVSSDKIFVFLRRCIKALWWRECNFGLILFLLQATAGQDNQVVSYLDLINATLLWRGRLDIEIFANHKYETPGTEC